MPARLDHRPAVLVEKQAWPHDTTDLDVDPSLHLGQLSNGFRYILKKNHTPQDRVSMHLFVQTGSLAEADQERGMAHFLEHMLFNGSTHFEPDELVKYFQRIGMQFGPDANAHTGFGQTVYDILLPTADIQSLSEAMLVLRDYAEGALLLPQQVEKEKKIVLAEKRVRDSAQYRTMLSTFQFEMPGALPALRFPIGLQETIARFDQPLLRGFYDAWYRPERMTLVMVGPFDPTQAQHLVEEHFQSMRARASARPLPSLGTFRHEGLKAFYHFEKEIGATTVRIGTIDLHRQPQDSKAWQKHEMISELANHMVQNRLDKMLQNPDNGMSAADIGSGYYLQQIRYAEISADCKSDRWEQALQGIERVLRQTLAFGFTPAEFQRTKQSYLALLQRDLKEAETRDSQDIAQGIMKDLDEWRVLLSPAQRLDLFTSLLTTIGLEEIHKRFAQTWSASHRLVLVTGDADLTRKAASPEEQITSVYEQSTLAAVQPPVDAVAMGFPYLPAPAGPGKIQHRVAIKDLGIEQIDFANGLRLTLKPTPFKANEVLASLSFGRGKSSEPQDQPGLAEVTEALLNEAGFGALDRAGLEQALSGHLADIRFEVREDMFVLNGNAVTKEVPLLLELMRTFLLDPGYRPEALTVVSKRLEQQYQSMMHTPLGIMQLEGQRFLAGGDSRFGWPSQPSNQNPSLARIRSWYAEQSTHSPLELTVVGDFEPDRLVELVAHTLGSVSLATQPLASDLSRTNPTFPNGRELHLQVDTKIPKALVVVAYPTEDFWDIGRTRRLSLLGELFSERLRVRIREKLGAAYSPNAFNHPYRAYSGYGVFQAHIEVDPIQATNVAAQVRDIAVEIRETRIGADEFRRVLDPVLTRIKDLRQSNVYWLNSVLVGSSRHPEQLAWARTIEADYAAITADEVAALARRYLDNRKAATVTITPAGLVSEPDAH